MSITDNPDARPVAYAYSDRPEPGLYREPGLYPEPPAAVQAKALRLGKGALAAILLGTVAVGAALGFAVFDYTGSQPRPAVVAPSGGPPAAVPAPAPPPSPAPDPGQAAEPPGSAGQGPTPPAAPGNTNVIIGGGIVGGGGRIPRGYGPHPHCHWVPGPKILEHTPPPNGPLKLHQLPGHCV